MIIVPELKTVFILVPRTGSGSLYRELRRVYPKHMVLYRHMEADGVPQGYDRWKRVGFVRHPVTRLLSLYRFMQQFGGGAQVQGGTASADALRIRQQVQGKTFEEWVTTNQQPFSQPCDINGGGDWWPVLSKRDPSPENLRSQFSYLRPDLGTEVLKFEDLPRHMIGWGLNPDEKHNTTYAVKEQIDGAARNHIMKFCSWDFAQGCAYL